MQHDQAQIAVIEDPAGAHPTSPVGVPGAPAAAAEAEIAARKALVVGILEEPMKHNTSI